MSKLWRSIGRKGLRDQEGNLTKKGERYFNTVANAANRNSSPGLPIQVAGILRRAEGNLVKPAHEHIKLPSYSKAALKNAERRQALAGRLLSEEEITAAAAERAFKHRFNLGRQKVRSLRARGKISKRGVRAA